MWLMNIDNGVTELYKFSDSLTLLEKMELWHIRNMKLTYYHHCFPCG